MTGSAIRACFSFLVATLLAGQSAYAEDLFKKAQTAHVAGDHKANAIGDVLTIVVYQNAEARNAAQNSAQKGRSASGALNTDALQQNGEVELNGEYVGRGEVRRSDSLVTQISVNVIDVLPNGDLLISGEQVMRVNGERTHIAVRGRVRPQDIDRDNRVISTRVADAEIDYDGDGFVSRNADPGLIGWLFSLLGLAG